MFADRARGSCAAVLLDDRTVAHSARQSPPSAQPQLTPLSWEQPHERPSNKVDALEEKSPRQASAGGIKPCRVPYPMKASLLLLVVAIIATPTSTVLAPGFGLVTGAFAAPCTSETTATSAATGGGAGTQHVVNVTSTADVNLTSIFDCEGGNFEVYWSGEVDVTDTIVIGNGTTVRIFGDDNSIEGDSGLSDDDEVVANLTSGLALPLGLTSAAVGMGPPNVTAGAEKPASFGSMFYVDGGILILEDLIVRGGFADNTTAGLDGVGGFYGSGGGIYAVNSSVFVTRCDFNDNFAENMGGGIFAVESTVEVVDAMFIGCTAGFMATFDDEDQEGAGGGIYVSSLVMYAIRCSLHAHFGVSSLGLRLKRWRSFSLPIDSG